MELTILYETDDKVVCIKPQGVESEHQLPALLREQLGCSAVYPVHRLDKETGGVMVFAKTKSAAAELSRQAQDGCMQKTYLAVVNGIPKEPRGRWEDLLFRDRAKNKSYVVKRERKGVKIASLSYEVLAEARLNEQTVSLVRITLHTGRTHQIRAQFSARGHSLLGDRRYGGTAASKMALWAYQLCLEEQGEKKSFTAAPPPEDGWTVFGNGNFE